MLARNGLYGDYFGFYLCDAILKVNGKGGQPVYVKLAGQDTGRCTAEMTRFRIKRPNIKPLAERNRLAVGVVGIAVLVAAVVAAFSYDKIPFVKGTSDYSAYFAEAGGIKPGSDVRVSGLSVGRVSDVKLDGTRVLVDFTVDNGVELGDRTEAAIKAETVLGTKMLELTRAATANSPAPYPSSERVAVRPARRPRRPDDHHQRSGHHAVVVGVDDLADTFSETPPELKPALEGVARFSDTLNSAMRNCAACSPTRTRSPRYWASAAIRSPSSVSTPTSCWERF